MDIPLTYFKKRIQIVDEIVLRQHAVTIKTNFVQFINVTYVNELGKIC